MAHVRENRKQERLRVVVSNTPDDDVVIVIANVSDEFRFSRTNGKWKTSLRRRRGRIRRRCRRRVYNK